MSKKNTRKLSPAQLLRSLLHDISSPLSTLMYSQCLINHDQLNVNTRELFILHKKAVDQMRQIISSCKNAFFKTPAENNKFSPKSVCLRLLDIFKLDLDSYNINVQLNIPKAILVNGDQIMFERLILNIIKNAIQTLKTISRKRVIQIQGDVSEQKLCIKVIDNGSGMSVQQIAKLFRDGTLSEPQNANLSWGLRYVKQIVDLHFAGDFSITSKKNKFTEVKVLIKNVAN